MMFERLYELLDEFCALAGEDDDEYVGLADEVHQAVSSMGTVEENLKESIKTAKQKA